jgi:3-hydroxybutyryl-CoA dehydrogenase
MPTHPNQINNSIAGRRALIGVVGAGAMGTGIAQVAILGGHPVIFYDSREGAADRGCAVIRENLQKLASKGRISTAQLDAAGLTQAATNLSDVKYASLVVEAIVEDLEIKRQLFQGLEKIVASDAILASNTSSLSITALAATLSHPERLAGFHFFNPAPVMPLVEIVAGLATSREVPDTLHSLAGVWGKKPVHVRCTPGFIVNRVARPFYGEALRALEERARRGGDSRRAHPRRRRIPHGALRTHGPDRPRRELRRDPLAVRRILL